MDTYTPSLVANAFLYKARQCGDRLSHLKIQKLVFFVHAWSLAMLGSSYVNERPEAWDYGPVFGSLYHELKGFGRSDVDTYLEEMNPQTGQREPIMPARSNTDFWGLLEQVWDRYGHFSARQLSELTHEPGGPWEKARQNRNGWLEDDTVRDYYREKLQHEH